MSKRKLSTFERLSKGERVSRRERRDLERRMGAADPGLEVVHANAAGIDIGSRSHFVAVPAGRDEEPVQEFGTWTQDLHRMADWLKQCGIRTVAMQSTSVYGIPAMEVLEGAGLEVYLVNAHGTRNLPGRKSDVQECQWLMKLHTYGLLRDSFRPPDEIRAIRTLWRQRQRLVSDAGRTVQQMQKALTVMNVQLSTVISDISGFTGMAIIRAIPGGERDPWALAALRDSKVRASEEEVARSLEGHWRDDVIFELRQVVEAHDFHHKQIAACDGELKKYMALLPTRERAIEATTDVDGPATKKRSKTRPKRKDEPQFDLRGELQRTVGVDLTRIDGIGTLTAQVILTELGSDLSAFPDEHQFASWLELVPRKNITGGKVISQKARQSKNRVAQALRMAAESLWHSDSYLGARYRKLRARMDGKCAVKAMAHHLALLVYRLITKGQEYVDRGAAYFERTRAQNDIRTLERKAAAVGMKLVQA